MQDALSLALANIATPPILAFLLGAFAAFIRSDLEIPEAMAKGLAIYLMFALGFKGGVSMQASLASGGAVQLAQSLALALLISFTLPLLAFALVRLLARVDRVNAAAISAHYGSVSVVTFLTAAEFLRARGIASEGYMVAVLAAMETPAIITGLLLARGGTPDLKPERVSALLREILANGSVVLLLGAFAIGWITGEPGEAAVKPLITDLFKGLLCLFLLEMGLVAARQLRAAGGMTFGLIAFGLIMPIIGATIGLGGARLVGLSAGGSALLATLCASASYIAVPAAMRLALPQAKPALYLTLSLGITFPFNIAIGIPLYIAAAIRFAG